MKGNSLLALVACSLLASCAEPVTAPPDSEDSQPLFARGGRPFTPGEQQPVKDDGTGRYFIYPVGDGQILAQTFSPTNNQRLGYIELPVACGTGVLLNIKIREGLYGPIMYEANTSGLPTTAPVDFQLIQVYDPATSHGLKIRKNRTYAFELSAFPAGSCSIAAGPAGDPYARGHGYFDAPPNAAGWLRIPGRDDLPFITRVR